MTRTFVALFVSAALAALAAGSALGADAACTPGMRTVGGKPVRTFCGPAKAVVKLPGGKVLRFAGGSCARESGLWAVNVGSITLGTTKGKFPYFGLAAEATKPGTYANQTVGWQVPGGSGALQDALVTIGAGMKRGSFSGRLLGGGGTVTGTFSC